MYQDTQEGRRTKLSTQADNFVGGRGRKQADIMKKEVETGLFWEVLLERKTREKGGNSLFNPEPAGYNV